MSWARRILRVDLTKGTCKAEPLNMEWARAYIGSRGLATKYFASEGDAKMDPLSPANKIIWATGPLTGTMASTGGRYTVITKGPLTGAIACSNSGGHWGAELKMAGWDMIVFEGKSPKPVYLFVENDTAQLLDAEWLWGKTVWETEPMLRTRHQDPLIRVSSIGRAGETGCLYAAVVNGYWMALYRPIFIVMSLLLFALFLSAQAVFGAARWFQVGVLFLQPTEFAKIASILLLARYFDKTQNQPRDLRWILGAFFWVMGLGIWILLQPNLSNVVVLMVILGSLLWINGIQLKHLAVFGSIGIILVGSIVALSTLRIRIPFLQEYQQDRIANFVVPDQTATFGATYNVSQALIAIGSGGWFGKGYMHGTQTQLRFLKVRHTDFIFSAISEEFGMVGALLVITILVLVIWRCLRVAQKARDVAGMNIAYGVATLVFFQGMVNIGVNLNIVPVSGLPLPFISYGGSGLTSLMLGIGLVESVAMRQKQLDF